MMLDVTGTVINAYADPSVLIHKKVLKNLNLYLMHMVVFFCFVFFITVFPKLDVKQITINHLA